MQQKGKILLTKFYRLLTVFIAVLYFSLISSHAQDVMGGGSQFEELIKKADSFFDAKDYLKARTFYQAALKINPNDAHAKKRVKDAQTFLDKQLDSEIDEDIDADKAVEEKKKKYKIAVDKGNAAYDKAKYEEAKTFYEEAIKLDPEETFPSTRLAEIKVKLEAAQSDAKFKELLAKGDLLYKTKKLEEAKTAFTDALKIKQDPTIQQKIEEINKTIAEQAAQNKIESEFRAAVSKGDAAFNAKNFQEAISAYEDAVKIKSGDKMVESKLNSAKTEFEKVNKAAQLEKDYKTAIEKADKLFSEKNYEEAKKSYTEANKLKPSEPYPSNKLKEIESALADKAKQEKLENDFKTVIQNADKAFNAKDYQNAIKDYQTASILKPNDKYAIDQIAKAQKALEALANEQKLNADFQNLVKEAEAALNAKKYIDAKTSFEKALGLKPSEAAVKTKITEVTKLIEEQNKQAELDKKYNDAILMAESSFKEGNLEQAKSAYTQAQQLKPTESVPKQKIQEIEQLIAAKKNAEKLEADYKLALREGDAALQAKDLSKAKAAFEKALGLKPSEAIPKAKLAETEKLIAEKSANEKLETEFKAILQKADASLSTKDFQNAIKSYNDALKLKPGDKQVTEQLAKAQQLQNDAETLQKTEAEYQNAIKEAETLLAAKKYQEAKVSYEKALAIKPNEALPKTKIAEINKVLEEIAKNQEAEKKYNDIIAQAEQQLKEGNLEQAKDNFKQASLLKPVETLPKDKIAQIEQLIASKKNAEKLELDFQAAIKEGDAAFTAKDLEKAKAAYEKAQSLKPGEKIPQEKISNIISLMAEKAKADKLENDYQNAIKAADKSFTDKKYQEAIAFYQDALKLKSQEKYPTDQITKINQILDEAKKQNQIENQYIEVLQEAEMLYAQNKIQESLESYEKALNLKPGEAFVSNKIELIKKKLEAQAKEQETEKAYTDAIKQAEDAIKADQLSDAKTALQKALTVKPNDAAAKQKINDLDLLIAAKTNAEKTEQGFKAAFEEGESNLKQNNLEKAKQAFEKALTFKPQDAIAKQKLTDIENKIASKLKEENTQKAYLAEIENAEKAANSQNYPAAISAINQALKIKQNDELALKKLAEYQQLQQQKTSSEKLESEFAEIITKGNDFLAKANYVEAKKSYEDALKLKPNDNTATSKLAETNQKLAASEKQKQNEELFQNQVLRAENALKQKNYAEALAAFQQALTLKTDDKNMQAKIAETQNLINTEKINAEKLAQYQNLIKQADDLFAKTEYPKAKELYSQAAQLNNNEKYPNDKIAEIDQLLKELAKNEKQNQEYQNAIAKADSYFESKKWNEALAAYKEAQAIKKGDEYSNKKIIEINQNLQAAKAEAELKDKYLAAIAKGEEALKNNNLAEAKQFFGQAITLMPTEIYPSQKINEIDSKLAAAKKSEKIEAEYKLTIDKAEKALEKYDYPTALKLFNEAKLIKPEESLPDAKIAEINQITAKQNIEKEKESRYATAIKRGDKAMETKDWQGAVLAYQEALSVKDYESYPQQKIAEAEKNLKRQKDAEELDAKYLEAVMGGDRELANKNYKAAIDAFKQANGIKPKEAYPPQKIKEIEVLMNEAEKGKLIEEQYTQAIKEANALFSRKSWDEAKSKYQQAITIKSNEQYPKDKIAEIEKLKNESAQNDALNSNYQKLMTEAENLRLKELFTEAISKYREALTLKPDEKLPQQRIDEINQLMAKIKNDQAAQNQYNQFIAEADKLLTEKKYDEAKQSYLSAIGIRPEERYPKLKIDEIDNLLANLNKKDTKAEEFKKIVESAASEYTAKKYDAALKLYEQANKLIPSEELPIQRITEINAIKNNNAKYAKLIQDGDQLLDRKEWMDAYQKFSAATKLKPQEQYPKDKIAQLRKILQEQKQQSQTQNTEMPKAPIDVESKAEKLAKQYPVGLTEENVDFPEYNKKIVKKIINDGKRAKALTKVIYNFGTFYFDEENMPIREQYFEKAQEIKK
jgi:tetratricopeptide (TPR) repeat protein